MRSILLLCLIISFIYLGGCINIALSTQLHRKSVEERVKSIEEGVTTKEQVLLTLGEPDSVKSNERVFLYYIHEIYGPLMYQVPVQTAGEEVVFSNLLYLRIEFDENNTVKSLKIDRKWSEEIGIKW